jgi:signal transduction histidine kinase
MNQRESELLHGVASLVEERSNGIVDRWLAYLAERLSLRPVSLLPTAAMRDHMPDVLRGLAGTLRAPGGGLTLEAIEHLSELARLRREQGYGVQEILIEFDMLNEIVFDETIQWLEGREVGQPELVSVLAILRSAGNALAMITVDAYQTSEHRERREVAEHLSVFARTLEHEIRTPLQAALNSAELLEGENVVDELRHHYARVIQTRLERVNELLHDVRVLTVAEDAGGHARWEPVGRVLRAVLDEVGSMARERDVTVRIAEPLPALQVDASRFQVAVMNLVTNGIKYSDAAKGERWVEVSVSEKDGEEPAWLVSVRDNGVGIAAEMQSPIFRRFVRAHPEVAPGTGMGLTIVREVIEHHGGKVQLESEVGIGTTFTLQLPSGLAAMQKEEESGVEAHESAQSEIARGAGKLDTDADAGT